MIRRAGDKEGNGHGLGSACAAAGSGRAGSPTLDDGVRPLAERLSGHPKRRARHFEYFDGCDGSSGGRMPETAIGPSGEGAKAGNGLSARGLRRQSSGPALRTLPVLYLCVREHAQSESQLLLESLGVGGGADAGEKGGKGGNGRRERARGETDWHGTVAAELMVAGLCTLERSLRPAAVVGLGPPRGRGGAAAAVANRSHHRSHGQGVLSTTPKPQSAYRNW